MRVAIAILSNGFITACMYSPGHGGGPQGAETKTIVTLRYSVQSVLPPR